VVVLADLALEKKIPGHFHEKLIQLHRWNSSNGNQETKEFNQNKKVLRAGTVA
jgi:hypothetical protein